MSKDISLDLRLRAINLSILLYGDETWILSVESTKTLEAQEMWIFKRLARVDLVLRDRPAISNKNLQVVIF